MADITIIEQTGFGLANILPARGVDAARIEAALEGEALALLATGPGQWLAHADAAGPDWADGLDARLSGLAGVVDQSSGYVIFALSGADARRLLQKGLPVDLSPSSFPIGAVVVSAIAHIGVIAHHRAANTFHLAIFRSFAESFRHWLDASAAAL